MAVELQGKLQSKLPNDNFKRELRARAKELDGSFTVNILDIMGMGSMYLPGTTNDITNDHLLVAIGSVVYKALVLLGNDPGFRASMKLDDSTCFDAYEQWEDSETGMGYIVNVPSECVWCAISFVKHRFYSQVEGGEPDFFIGMSKRDVFKFLHRLAFSEHSIKKMMKHYDANPEMVRDLLRETTSQAVYRLIDNEYAKHEKTQETAVEDAHSEKCEQSEDVSEKGPQALEKPQFLSNEAICERVCADIRRRISNIAVSQELCEHVEDVIKSYNCADGGKVLHLSNMDQYVRGRMFDASIAQVLVACNMLLGSNRKYSNILLDALLLMKSPHEKNEEIANGDTSSEDKVEKIDEE